MIEKNPTVTLKTRLETLAWLAANLETYPERYSVMSEWLCDELDRFEEDGYVFNRAAQERICAENGLTFEESCRRVPGVTSRTEGGLLGALVFNAQAYRRARKLRRGGWQRWRELPAEVCRALIGKTVRVLANGELTGERPAKVVVVGEQLRLAPPRTRTKFFADYQDLWIKTA